MRPLGALLFGLLFISAVGCGSTIDGGGGSGGNGGNSGQGGQGGSNPETCGGIAGIPCAAGFVCDINTPGMCGAADLGGVCKQKPDACAEIYAPVCGCDNVTYGNDCERLGAGAQLNHEGECATVVKECGGIAGIPCAPNEVCDITTENACGSADLMGQCKLKPDACDLIYAPVCGCDGVTYGNDCARLMAGVQLNHQGECP